MCTTNEPFMKLPVKIVLCLFCFQLIQHGYAQSSRKVSIDSMLLVLANAKTDTNKVKLLHQLTIAHDGLNQNQSLQYARQEYALAQKLKWNKGMLTALRYIGSLQMEMGRNKNALASFEHLYRLSAELKLKDEMILSLNNIGAVYESTSKHTSAADYFFKALKIAEQIKHFFLIAKCESNIAVLFIQQGDFEKARYYAKKADEQYRHLDEPSYEAKNLEVLGNCYAFDKKYEQAKPYYLRALKLYERVGDQMGMATVYTQMVDCYSGDPLKRIDYLQKAKSLWDKLAPNNLNAIANIGNYGYVYFDILKNPAMLKIVENKLRLNKEQMLKDAEVYLNTSIKLSRQAGISDLVSQLTIVYSELCEYKKDYKGALDNLKAHVKLQDSISSQEIKNKIARLEGERGIAVRDKEIQSAKLEMKQFWLYGVITISGLILLSFYFLNRSRISQLRLKNELQKKEAEEKTKELLHRNKLSESELKAIRAQMNPHFIFNVLNSIESYIVENDSKTASRLVQKFASLSRLILENSTQSMVTAEREWKALKLYTELEAMRFSNQFSYSFSVDPLLDLTKLMLPPMLVQPLIENAIHHGMRNSTAENNMINISLEQTEMEILFIVEDNGAGIDEAENFKTFSAIKSKSIGLSAIRERIEIFNVMNERQPASFQVYKKEVKEGPGTVAKLTLPKVLREAAG
jgi:tetratricopeptide (TPR) repeat protein